MAFSTRHIDYLERNYLDGLNGEIEHADSFETPKIETIRFLKIVGITRHWKGIEGRIKAARGLMEDVLTGLSGEGMPVIYLIIGEPTRINVYIGTYQESGFASKLTVEDNIQTLGSALQSGYPGIEIQRVETPVLTESLNTFKYGGLLTGTPTIKVEAEEDKGTPGFEGEQIERMIRGLYQSHWGYLVVATPMSQGEVVDFHNIVLNELRLIVDAETVQQTRADLGNPIARTYMKTLEAYREKLNLGKTEGMWHAAVYLLSEDFKDFSRAKAIVGSVFGGKKSIPDPIRILECHRLIDGIRKFGLVKIAAPSPPGRVRHPYKYLSLLNSMELSSLVYLPLQEMPGYFVKDYARFDVASKPVEDEDAIGFGEITDQRRPMGTKYMVPIKDLNSHALIVGITGGGKTNTCFHIIKQIWNKGVPFLVIEPAKNEYRKLIFSEELGKDLQLFTMGDDSVSPFRLNPFEIMPGVPVQTHIDLLKSVFNASFVMYAPMPYVLEQCIHEIYEEKGWNLITNDNERGRHWTAHPTLTDLYRKIDEFVDRLGYEQRVTMDVKAALKTRINNLRVGSKGLMLDTRRSVPIEEIVKRPTIIELEKIGDDDEKAFVMGLLLIFLYEHYLTQGLREGGPLKHITVIEEAHRLLKNVSTEQFMEEANIRGKAVETFCNVLSEIRAYGEGFLILDQIPSKLALDAVKNTSLKVVHRLVSSDDRALVGGSMNFDEEKERRVASLGVGEAAIHAAGDDGALLIKVPYVKIPSIDRFTKDEENDMVRDAMEGFRERMSAVYTPFKACSLYCNDVCKYHKRAQRIVDDPKFWEIFSMYVLSGVIDWSALFKEYPLLQQGIEERKRGLELDKGFSKCVIVQGADRYFERRGQQYGWKYGDVEKLKDIFTGIMNTIVDAYPQRELDEQEQGVLVEQILDLQQNYLKLCQRQYNPFFGCEDTCVDGLCLYRYNVMDLLYDEGLSRRFTRIVSSFKGDKMWEKLGVICQSAARRAVSEATGREPRKRASVCFAIQKGFTNPYFDSFQREKIVTSMLRLFNEQKK